MGSGTATQEPIVLVIDFHHARGPEIERCFCEDGTDPVAENDWSLLPFMGLTDGAHTSTEDFSYFTLKRDETPSAPATSLFGISCSRQMDASTLINRPPEVTRSTVQKAVVVIINEPRHFGQLREKLSIVTSAWFAQRDFSDFDILRKFWEGLKISLNSEEAKKEEHLGLSLREMIHEFKHQTLVLFKCLLLQPKMLFFGSRCERLCMLQFSLISLIPGLIHHLEDCADPSFDTYAQHVEKPTSLKTSERSSLLAYMGLPLQIFGKGSMFGPYTPLQHLDLLADHGTKSYVVGSTNSLLLQQKDRYSDILINLDEDNVSISSPSLRAALSLSVADRRWIDFLTQTINETWDEAHPERPKTHGYLGSEEFIRLQFEEYLLALLSSMKYHNELVQSGSGAPLHPSGGPKSPTTGSQAATDIDGDPALEFNADFLELWQTTSNYALFNRLTSDALLFSIVEPRHPCAGGLGLEDIQRRLTQQVADLHLDERVREGREAVQKHFTTGQKKVSTAFNTFWTDIEAMREAQRKKNGQRNHPSTEGEASSEKEPKSSVSSPRPSLSSVNSWSIGAKKPPAVDMSQVQATAAAAGQRASAYFSSWGSWASDRRKEWQEKRSTNSAVTSPTATPKPSSIMSKSELADEVMPPIRSEEPSGVTRSSSRTGRWSNIFTQPESEDSVASTPAVHDRPLEQNENQTGSVTAPDNQPPASEPLPSTASPDHETSDSRTPTPTLTPSDKDHAPSTSSGPDVSPPREEEPENAFTSIDLTPDPSKDDSESKSKTDDDSTGPTAQAGQN